MFCMGVPIVGWYIIKTLLLKAKDEPVYKAAYKRLLYNSDTFNQLLQQQLERGDVLKDFPLLISTHFNFKDVR